MSAGLFSCLKGGIEVAKGDNKYYDTYDMWKDNGQLEEIIKFVKESIVNMATKGEIAKALKVTPKCIIELRKTHKDFE